MKRNPLAGPAPARLLRSAAVLALLGATPALADDAELLAKVCGDCHTTAADGTLSRISGQRKTPEAWLMTIVRMRMSHGADIDRQTEAALVRYLADTQGLAPSEAEPYRYALEKDPNMVEAIDEPLGTMCARCHTGARALLQHRTPEEWRTLIDFHVGQFPTIEYQALGRDREWYKIASTEIAELLATTQPRDTEAWSQWQVADKPGVAGDWIVLTTLPGAGQAYGRLTVSGDASPFAVSGDLTLADGSTQAVSGQMNLYTGYEWRATLDIGGQSYRQVLALDGAGGLSGRQFLTAQDSLGGHLSGVRADAGAHVLGTVPEAVAGLSGTVQVVGAGLEGLTVEGAAADGLAANAAGASVTLSAEAQGRAVLSAGDSSVGVALYTAPDRLTVEPEFTIARVGGGSDVGPAAVPALFSAVGWLNGPDGAAGTGDDIRIGSLSAEWTTTDANETAAMMQDAAYAGTLDRSGLFMPAVAGPNAERPFSTNNAGDLTITAKAGGLEASGRLIVTVQRFIDPPLR